MPQRVKIPHAKPRQKRVNNGLVFGPSFPAIFAVALQGFDQAALVKHQTFFAVTSIISRIKFTSLSFLKYKASL